MTYSPLEEPLSPHWTACSRSPVDNMPSPDGSPTSPASPGYSITSPTYDSPHSPRSPFYQPTQSAKKDIYAYNWKDYVDDIPRLPSRPRALTPTGFRENDTQQQRNVTATYQTSSWFKIPPNLRRDILVLAFGGRRLHMCLKCDADPPNAWHFFGMVCRHVPTGAKGPMTRGLLQGPWSDECDFQLKDPDPEVVLESVGVMGWLLSCRQNYAETIDILYSKNTILIYDEPLLTYIDQVILPHRVSLITALELEWEPESAADYGETFFNLLQQPRFPNLKRLYISAQFIWDYHPSWFDTLCGHMDNLVKTRPGLTECAIAVPHQAFDDGASQYVKKKDSWKRGTFSQLWYSVDRSEGGPETIKLPYVNSYPHPPFHLGPNAGVGWWLLEGTDARLSWRWASSPVYYGSPTPGWEDWEGYGSN